MKHIILFCILAFSPALCIGQDTINPYNIAQPMTIILQNTDVYYYPFAPPADTDTRAWLSNESGILRDSDGIYNAWTAPNPWDGYQPITHGVRFVAWTPPGDTAPLGRFAVWQRLFQAKNKPDGTPSDIIAGGIDTIRDTVIFPRFLLPPDTVINTHLVRHQVTVSKNEDVDFRASGRIKLKSGFHVKPGAFFHAYTEPKWDTAVFSDEFDDATKFHSQWHVGNGHGGNDYPQGAQCVIDSNVNLVMDTGANGAHDGYALDIAMRETLPDTGMTPVLTDSTFDQCENVLDLRDTTPLRFIFSSGIIRSCPFPFNQRDTFPLAPAYAHLPYAKYEIREKIPHVRHHTNNWGGGWNYGLEYDLNETGENDTMGIIQPDFNHQLRYGPYKGAFGNVHDTVIFFSSQPNWCLSKNPNDIIINNVPYQVQFVPHHGMDTLMAASFQQYMAWPSSFTPGDTFSFYYSINSGCTADTLPWTVDTDSSRTWRKFYAAYHDSLSTLLHFSKTNQPTSVTLTTQITPVRKQKTFNCHWEYNLNPPHGTGDSGILMLDFPSNDTDSVATMAWSDLHSGTEAYSFNLYSGPGYPMPPLQFNADDTTPSSYQYHTFAMEWLPHEVRILVDSIVVRRLPDRLIPANSPYYDWILTLPRTLTDIRPAEFDLDPLTNNNSDPFDTVPGTNEYNERKYFEHAASVPGWPGFWDVQIPPVTGPWYHAAHHLIDYVKVWDVPKDVKIPDLPQH